MPAYCQTVAYSPAPSAREKLMNHYSVNKTFF